MGFRNNMIFPPLKGGNQPPGGKIWGEESRGCWRTHAPVARPLYNREKGENAVSASTLMSYNSNGTTKARATLTSTRRG